MKGYGSQQYEHLQEKTVCLNSEILGLGAEGADEYQTLPFDPFEKVILIKDIDNQILTSFRTLKGENNSVSDTSKVIHRKFLGSRNQNRFYKSHALHMTNKQLY